MCKCKESITMNSCNYVENVLNTESKVTPALIERITDNPTIAGIQVYLKECIIDSENLDRYKKHIFYGKNLGDIVTDEDGLFCVEGVNERLKDETTIRLLHSGMGMLTEAGEFLKMLYDHIFLGTPVDKPNLREEISDTYWYTGIGLDSLDSTMNEILTMNIDKLKRRYPEKFTEHHAINRDLVGEREILEQGGKL